jgi:hypothetical protein
MVAWQAIWAKWLGSGTIPSMRFTLAVVVLAFAGGQCGTTPPGKAEVSVSPPEYTEDAHAPPEVRKKCQFDKELAQEIAKASPKAAVGGTGGKTLSMKVIHMRGADPTYGGEISVVVEGELIELGSPIGSFKARYTALPGVMGGMGGICRGLDTIASFMAEDIAVFIDAPKMRVQLEG